MHRFVLIVDFVNNWVSKIFSVFVYPCIAIVFIEVVRRYVFNSPSDYGHELSSMLFGVTVILGGGCVFLHGGHITIDIISGRLEPRKRAVLDLVTSVFFLFFVSAMIWLSMEDFILSFGWRERTQTPWGPPVYPLKFAAFVGCVLLLLGGTTKIIRDFYTALGKKLEKVSEETRVKEEII